MIASVRGTLWEIYGSNSSLDDTAVWTLWWCGWTLLLMEGQEFDWRGRQQNKKRWKVQSLELCCWSINHNLVFLLFFSTPADMGLSFTRILRIVILERLMNLGWKDHFWNWGKWICEEPQTKRAENDPNERTENDPNMMLSSSPPRKLCPRKRC